MDIALIGVGYWGSKLKKYIPEHFNLKYAVDSKFDLDIIWNDQSIDCVIIATPIETHYNLCKKALNNGLHVFCEKPITLKYEEALELKQLAESKNLQIAVDYVQTFSPAILKVKELLYCLSPIRYIEMGTKHLGRFMGHDVYKLLASHHLSILGTFIDMQTLSVTYKDKLFYDDYCTSGIIEFDLGRIEVSLDFPDKEMYMHIYGDNWTIKYTPLTECSVSCTVYNHNFKALPEELTEGNQQFYFNEDHNLYFSVKYFKNLILGKAVSNITTSAEITRLLEAR